MCLLFILLYNGPSQEQGLVLCLFCPRRRVKLLPAPLSWTPKKKRQEISSRHYRDPLISSPLASMCVGLCGCVWVGARARLCVFQRSDICPRPLFLEKRALAGACNDSSWTTTITAWVHFQSDCQNHTRQICNRTLTSRAHCSLASARTGAPADPRGSHLALGPFPCAMWTLALWETKGCLMSVDLLHGRDRRRNTYRHVSVN